MALREDLLPVFGAARQLIQDLGLRTARVWIRRNAWDGGEILLGDLETTDTEILPRPRVRERSRNLEITRITPDYTTGGYSPADLQPDPLTGEDWHYAVQMPDGRIGAYRLADIAIDRNFGYSLTLEPIEAHGRLTPDY